MKRRLSAFLLCLVSLWFSTSGNALAQPTDPLLPAPQSPPTWQSELSTIQNAQAAAVVVGQPGLSFRYMQTFGETGKGYLDDTNHFYQVAGVHATSAGLWLVDTWGWRALRFDASGNFQQQIGVASQRDATGASLDYLTDIATDGSGNVWIVSASAAQVVKYDASGKLIGRLGKQWNPGTANDQFDRPIGIAIDGAGNLYVSESGQWDESGNHRVQVFDSAGGYLATIGVTGVAGADNTHFRRPRHIAIYGSELFVADAGNHRVQIFNIATPAAPVYLATLGVTGVSGADNSHFNFPEGVGADATYLYVADSNNNRVQVFNRLTRAYVATLGSGAYGTGPNEFNHPSDVAVDGAGNLYVADQWNQRVQQYSSGRVYQRTYGTTGISYVTDGAHYLQPRGVAVGSDGSIHVVEELGHRLIKLNAAGVAQWTVGEPGQIGQDNEHLFFANDAAVDGAGRVYVADGENQRVQIFNSDGSYVRTLGGQSGAANDQFKSPSGVGLDATGNLYVADKDNHRVQIFDAAGVYLATLGQTGVAGSDNAHFNQPQDVAVDSNGLIYVADEGNDRVQVFNSSRQYVRTVGQTQSTGDSFDRFDGWGPHHVAVDGANRLYVGDSGNNRVQIFDSSGAYLTTIGGRSGGASGRFRGPFGVAIGPDGALYVADRDNNRIQKYAPGVPNWVQRNINGFGDRDRNVNALAPFGGHLYAGTSRYVTSGAQIWRMDAAGNWNAVMTDGFGKSTNAGIEHLMEFKGHLYAGTESSTDNPPYTAGGEIWRSSNGTTWEQVVDGGFGDLYNGGIFHMAVYSDQLYAGSWTYTNTLGAGIWRSSTGDAGDWTQVAVNGFGDPGNRAILTMQEFDGYLYAGTRSNSPNGADIWRYDGATWTPVVTDGFGDPATYDIAALAVLGDYLYAGTGRYDPNAQSYPGGQLWRCSRTSGCDEASDWNVVVADGFGKATNVNITALHTFDHDLYAMTYNGQSGMEVWRTADGVSWDQVGFAGLGDSNNGGPHWNNSLTTFNDNLFVGVYNPASAGKIWQFLDNLTNKIYLPNVKR